jgi:hypothetical protein
MAVTSTWRRDGREPYFISPDKRLVAVDVRTTPTFQPGAPVTLFQTRVPTSGLPDSRNFYKASSDGQRFLISTMPALPNLKPLRVMLNCTDRGARDHSQ